MRWLNGSRPTCSLQCVYCGVSGQFRHEKSYEYENETFSLYGCPGCKSLIYDLKMIDAPIVSQIDLITPEALRHARYHLECGISSYHVALCALSALPDVSPQELRQMYFVDVGAGMGMASHLVKTLFGMSTVTVEPSFTGKLSNEILGLEVHRAYFEKLPPKVLAEMAKKPCCLHLNSVVEHLVDPFVVLSDMVGRIKLEVLAVVVPDGAALDYDAPFLNTLPMLAPRDHRHLPTKRGMEILLKRLGFAHMHVDQADGLLSGIGSRSPIALPKMRTTTIAEHLFLENLMRHPNPMVAEGGAARLLPIAFLNANAPLMAEIRKRFPFEAEAERLLKKIDDGAWEDLPFHLGPSCYWLALDAMQAGRLEGALSLLKVSAAFADRMVEDYSIFAMTPLEFKWTALLLESAILAHQAQFEAAETPLLAILDSKSDARIGAKADHQKRAEADLKALRLKAEAHRKELKLEEDKTLEPAGKGGPAIQHLFAAKGAETGAERNRARVGA